MSTIHDSEFILIHSDHGCNQTAMGRGGEGRGSRVLILPARIAIRNNE
jgi:hypothetical protein